MSMTFSWSPLTKSFKLVQDHSFEIYFIHKNVCYPKCLEFKCSHRNWSISYSLVLSQIGKRATKKQIFGVGRFWWIKWYFYVYVWNMNVGMIDQSLYICLFIQWKYLAFLMPNNWNIISNFTFAGWQIFRGLSISLSQWNCKKKL